MSPRIAKFNKIDKFIESHGLETRITDDGVCFYVPCDHDGVACEHKFTVTTLREAAHALGY